MIDVGFTGTRSDMTPEQRDAVIGVLRGLLERVGFLVPSEHGPRFRGEWRAHHGDCVGADSTFVDIAKMLGGRVVAHLPLDESDRAHRLADEYRPPLPYMRRNCEIVRACQVLIAAPYTDRPVGKHPGGTWRTVEIADRSCREHYVVRRDGSVVQVVCGLEGGR